MNNCDKEKPDSLKEDKLNKALELIKKGYSYKTASLTCGVNKTTLSKKCNINSKRSYSNTQRFLPIESEKLLVSCLTKLGPNVTKIEIKRLVQDYVKTHLNADSEIGEHLRLYCKFKNGVPGKKWITSFLRRYELTLKNSSNLKKRDEIKLSSLNNSRNRKTPCCVSICTEHI